jgi:hypothetical protein
MVGPRSVYAYSGASNALLTEAFTVLSGDELPTIVEIVPNGLRQGQSDIVEFRLSSPLEASPLVDLGPGVLVESVDWSAPDLIRVTVSVDINAPLGERVAVLDDGVRAITGVNFDVRDQIVEPVGCYSAKPHRTSGVWWLMALSLGALIGRRSALR